MALEEEQKNLVKEMNDVVVTLAAAERVINRAVASVSKRPSLIEQRRKLRRKLAKLLHSRSKFLMCTTIQ